MLVRKIVRQTRLPLLIIAGLGLIVLVCIGTPKAWTAGDFEGPLAAARAIVSGRDPLAIAPLDDRYIPYPLTAATFILPLLLVPPIVISMLVVVALMAALHLLTQQNAPAAPPWGPLLVLAYVPLIFNLQLIQWAPLLLLALGLHEAFVRAADRRRRWAWLGAGLLCMPLIVKAQLVPMLVLPVLTMLVLERRWRILLATMAGWCLLVGLSLVLRPLWPFTWWQQTRPFAGTYPAPAFAAGWVGLIPLVLAGLVVFVAWKRRDNALLRVALLVAVSLVTPQRALYEAAILVAPLTLVLRRPRIALAVVALSWLIPFQQFLQIDPDHLLLFSVFLPMIIALLMVLQPAPNPQLTRRIASSSSTLHN
ncbi:MAG: hypothetical protein H7Y32_21610 [Chloroflexales bacterium]|nr:hypothetical protein [Chloroflexales bacterium]